MKLPKKVTTMLADSSTPFQLRKQLLLQLATTNTKEADQLLNGLLDAAGAANGEDLYKEKRKELQALMEHLMNGPLRMATFVRVVESAVIGRRAETRLPDGSTAFCMLPDDELAGRLRRGDTVWLEAQGKAVLFGEPDSAPADTGELGRLERCLDDERVEVSLRDRGRFIFLTSEMLSERLRAGEAEPGADVVLCPQRRIVFRDQPPEDGLAHFDYLVKEAPPDVVIERDIGAPPQFLDDLSEHVRMEIVDPALGRKYRLHRSAMVLLVGVPGSGKTLSMLGFWNRMYAIMSDITGVPVADLPPRVLRLRASQVLSKWLGESDKQLDRFFDETEELAERTFRAPDGREYELPVLVICEEIDGLARTRSSEDDVHGRIQTVLLQRLDTTAQKLRDRPIIFLFTTNTPHLVDPAFLRRAGGRVETFGRLSREAFWAVLDKHLRDRPFRRENGEAAAAAQQRILGDIATWIFSPNGEDPGQVEITLVGQANPIKKFRADFMTGGLVDRAVQQAAAKCCRAERHGQPRPGLDAPVLKEALHKQVRHTVDQLHPHNAHEHLTLPDGTRVSAVRRIEQAAILPFELERTAS